jgi:hypothetical protein
VDDVFFLAVVPDVDAERVSSSRTEKRARYAAVIGQCPDDATGTKFEVYLADSQCDVGFPREFFGSLGEVSGADIAVLTMGERS